MGSSGDRFFFYRGEVMKKSVAVVFLVLNFFLFPELLCTAPQSYCFGGWWLECLSLTYTDKLGS